MLSVGYLPEDCSSLVDVGAGKVMVPYACTELLLTL